MSMALRKATNSWKTSSGLSRSATVVAGARLPAAHAAARSKLPR